MIQPTADSQDSAAPLPGSRDHLVGPDAKRRDPPNSVSLELCLRHTQPLGELAPYFQGLLAGRAIAARCPICRTAWFPPQLDCPLHRKGIEWVELPGSGRLVDVTTKQTILPFGSEALRRAFVLVALDGADNLAFARFAGTPQEASVGRPVWISRAPGDWPHPAQSACFVGSVAERLVEDFGL